MDILTTTVGVVKVFSETETEKKWGFYANRISPIFSKGVRPNPQSFSVFVSFSENKVGKRRTETEKNRGFYGLTVNSKMSERELTLSGGHLPSKSSKFLCSLLWGCQSFIFEGQYDWSTNTIEKYVPQSFSVSVSDKTLTTPIVCVCVDTHRSCRFKPNQSNHSTNQLTYTHMHTHLGLIVVNVVMPFLDCFSLSLTRTHTHYYHYYRTTQTLASKRSKHLQSSERCYATFDKTTNTCARMKRRTSATHM